MLFYAIAIAVVLADQAAKWAVRTTMLPGETLPGWGPYLHFTYYENRGAAFSLFQGYGQYFAIVAAVFVAVVLYYRHKGKLKGPLLETAAGLMVGGAVGNGIDRAIFHKVTDFLVFGGRGGILNLADLAIQFGWMLLLVYLIRDQLQEMRLKKSKW